MSYVYRNGRKYRVTSSGMLEDVIDGAIIGVAVDMLSGGGDSLMDGMIGGAIGGALGGGLLGGIVGGLFGDDD